MNIRDIVNANAIRPPSIFLRNGVSTRSQMGSKISTNVKKVLANAKRKADGSPAKEVVTTKRLAFGDLTNNTAKSTLNSKKNVNSKVQQITKVKVAVDKQNIKPITKVATKQTSGKPSSTATTVAVNIAPRKTFVDFGKPLVPAGTTVVKVNSSTKNKTKSSEAKKNAVPKVTVEVIPATDSKIKQESVSPDSSSCCSGSSSTDNSFPPDVIIPKDKKIAKATIQTVTLSKRHLIPEVPPNVNDFDLENVNDPNQVSVYAMDVFNYLRERESKFKVSDYMPRQVCLSASMRALLVDWMVEVQETFELNHETLYLAVKLVDLYLCKMVVGKETLQLFGAACVFIASKFDERTPPMVEDFLYICDGAYTYNELIRAEMNVLRLVGYDLGIPLSYRFLRRFARCAKVTMPVLTLARFILETSLMDYSFVFESDSKLAAACMLLALKMKDLGGWTPTLEYYTSYVVEDVRAIALRLNNMLHQKPGANLNTVRNKYSHEIFFEVAKIPLIGNRQLC